MESATVNKQFNWGTRNYTHILKRQILNNKHCFNYNFVFQAFQVIYLYRTTCKKYKIIYILVSYSIYSKLVESAKEKLYKNNQAPSKNKTKHD